MNIPMTPHQYHPDAMDNCAVCGEGMMDPRHVAYRTASADEWRNLWQQAVDAKALADRKIGELEERLRALTASPQKDGAWTCKACGFRGFWRGGLHCIDGKVVATDVEPASPQKVPCEHEAIRAPQVADGYVCHKCGESVCGYPKCGCPEPWDCRKLGALGTVEKHAKVASPQKDKAREAWTPHGIKREGECVWVQDSDGPWNTSCGITWEFNEGGPNENNAHFCHHCGGALLPQYFSEVAHD